MGEQATQPEFPDVILLRRGDASPEAWRALGNMANSIGAQIEVNFEIPGATPEQEAPPRLASLTDFHAVARTHQRTQVAATKAWERLRVAFINAHNIGDEPPVVFATHPAETGPWRGDSLIDGLDIDSLARMTRELRSAITGRGKVKTNDIIHAKLGRNTNVETLKFLELVVASWASRSDESTQ